MKKKEPRLFSDLDSAYLFFSEYATCQLTGQNLWILDTGIINWDSIQIDHIIPWSKGGKTNLSNAALLSGHANFSASDTRKKIYNFQFGFPTNNYYYENNIISEKQKNQLLKFVRLLPSDFYFNRALESFLFGMEYRREPNRVNGKTKDRDDKYFAKSVLNWLKKWNIAKEDNWENFEKRKIINLDKLELDQQILLKIRDVNSEDDIMKLYEQLDPIYMHLFNCHEAFFKAYNVILNNFVLAKTLNFDEELNKYVEKQFSELLKLLNDKNTIPRYKKSSYDTIDFLKKLCSEIKKYRFYDPSSNEPIKANFYIATYKNILARQKKENDFYIQSTEKINCRFPKELINLDVGWILDFKGSQENWGNDVSDSDIEFFLNHLSITDDINYYFLINENDSTEIHKELIKEFLTEFSNKEVKTL